MLLTAVGLWCEWDEGNICGILLGSCPAFLTETEQIHGAKGLFAELIDTPGTHTIVRKPGMFFKVWACLWTLTEANRATALNYLSLSPLFLLLFFLKRVSVFTKHLLRVFLAASLTLFHLPELRRSKHVNNKGISLLSTRDSVFFPPGRLLISDRLTQCRRTSAFQSWHSIPSRQATLSDQEIDLDISKT